MKKFLMLLTFVVTACAQNDVPVDATDDVQMGNVQTDDVQMGVFEQLICGATACGSIEDSNARADCFAFHCGGDSGGGGGYGGGGGGGGGGGETCSGNQSCREWCFCKNGVFHIGTISPSTGFCSSVQASPGQCSA